MNRAGILYLKGEISEEDLPAIRKAIDDFPEGALNVDLPDLDKIVVMSYTSDNDFVAMKFPKGVLDITRIAIGREFSKGVSKPGKMSLKLEKNQLQEMNYTRRLFISSDAANLEVVVNGHMYIFGGFINLEKDYDLSPL